MKYKTATVSSFSRSAHPVVISFRGRRNFPRFPSPELTECEERDGKDGEDRKGATGIHAVGPVRYVFAEL